MKKLTFLSETKKLLDEVYLVEMKHNEKFALFRVKDWRTVLSLQEIKSLNYAYNKFISQAPILYESVTHLNTPIQLWENFLILEEEQGKKKGFFSRAWDKVKSAGKAVGSAVGKAYRKVRRGLSSATMGKVFGKGKEGREQEQEFSTQVVTSGVGKVLADSVPKYWPNNDEFEEFQENLTSAIEKGIEYINSLEDPEKKAEELKNLKKWIVYNADHNLGDRYKHFKGARRKEEKRQEESTLYHRSLKDLIFEEDEKKDEEKKADKIGTSRKESSSWAGLTSNKLIGALVAIGFVTGGAAFKLLSDAFQAAQAVATSVPPKEVPKEMTKEITEKVTGKKVDFKFDWWQDGKGGFDRGIDKAMIDAGFSPKNPESVKLFYTTLGEGDPVKGVEKIADSLKKTGKNREIFLAYFKEKVLPSGMAPREMGFSEGKFMGADMSGKPGTPLGVDGIRSSALTGAFTSMVVKKVVSMVLVKAAPAAAGAAGVGAGAAAAVGGAALAGLAAGALVSAGVIKWLRSRSQKESRLAVMMDLLDKVDEMYQKAGGKQEVIEVPPPQDSPNPGPDNKEPDNKEEDEDMSEDEEGSSAPVTCSPEEVKSKVLEVLKGAKFKKKINIDQVSNKISKVLTDKNPKTEEEITSALSAFKSMGEGLKSKITSAVKECFLSEEADFEEETETKPDETKPDETKAGGKKKIERNLFAGGGDATLADGFLNANKDIKSADDKKFAKNAITPLLKWMDKKQLVLREIRSRLLEKTGHAGTDDSDIVEKETYSGNAKDYAHFKELVNLAKENENFIPKDMSPEDFVASFLSYMIEKKRLAVADVEKPKKDSEEEEIEKNRERLASRFADSYTRKGIIMTERWQRLAGIN